MTRRKEVQNDIASIRLGQLLVCALIRFPVQVLPFRSLEVLRNGRENTKQLKD